MSIRYRLVSQSNRKSKLNSEQLFDSTDLSPVTFGAILSPKLRGKFQQILKLFRLIRMRIKNYKVRTINILLDIGASASIVHKDVLYERHKIFKDKKNKWSTMAGAFNITFITEIILKLPEFNHPAKKFTRNAI